MPARRGQVFLATKIRKRGYDEVMRLFDEALGRLRTDHVDLAAIEANGGSLRAVRRIREEKMTRFIGITSHKDPPVLKTALERHDFDCTQMSLNPALKGQRGDDSFEALVLPVATRKKMGVIAMKAFAQAQYEYSPERLVRYALSLPVSTVSVGMPNRQHLEEDVRLTEIHSLAARLSAIHKAKLDVFFRHHLDTSCDVSDTAC